MSDEVKQLTRQGQVIAFWGEVWRSLCEEAFEDIVSVL